GAADGIDPLLLLLLGVSDEVHGLAPGGDFEGEGAIEDVLGALDGETGGDRDDAAGSGRAGDGGVLEPEELPLLQNEPPAAPRLDVLPLLRQPPRPLRGGPERHALLLLLRRGSRSSEYRSPQAGRHRLVPSLYGAFFSSAGPCAFLVVSGYEAGIMPFLGLLNCAPPSCPFSVERLDCDGLLKGER
ncbi:unnamed protein product, partial [Musa textilis]